MATLVSWGTSGGQKGRCDARCHNAKGARCTCCCGGHYHGAARDGTLGQKVEALQEELLKGLAAEGKEARGQLPLRVSAVV